MSGQDKTVDKDYCKKLTRKVWKIVRPKKFKIADDATLERILNPPPRFPVPEYKGQEYVHGPEIESEYIFMCNELDCEAKFTTALGLTLHLKKHNDPQNKCKFCGMCFKTALDLSEHSNAFHPDLDKNPNANPLQCQKCGKCSRDVKALWRHVRESHRDRSYPCPHCNFPFTRPENLKQHLEVKHLPEGTEKKHKCKICGVEYVHKNSLRGHIRRQHRGCTEETFRCVICSTVYFNRDAYNFHMKIHSNPKFFSCLICKAKFRTAGHLRRHENTLSHINLVKRNKLKKTEVDSFQVPVIITVKTTNSNLSKEELIELCRKTSVKILLHRVDHEVVERSIAKIDRRGILKSLAHEEMEEQVSQKLSETTDGRQADAVVKEYLNCVYCEKVLPNLNAVKSHEKICYLMKRTKKLIMCPICDKEFDRASRLKLHARSHSEDKPFKCAYCDARFKTNVTRSNHVKYAHFNIRQKPFTKVYKCTYEGCSKQYGKLETLRDHEGSVHLGIRLPCEQCGRTFRGKHILRKHIEHVHAECPILLECKPCNRIYKLRKTYLAHLKKNRHARKTREYEKRQNGRIGSKRKRYLQRLCEGSGA